MLKQYQSCLKIYILNFFKGDGMKQKRFWRNHKIPAKRNRRIFKVLENTKRSQRFSNRRKDL